MIHRLTRFEDPALRKAAREWLAEKQAARAAARHRRERAAERQERRRTVILTVALVAAWATILFVLFLR